MLAYQSGLLANLPGSLSAPRCYGIAEYPGEEFWIWLEDIQQPADEWTLERHSLAARHLGQFNGAYLAGYPLPEAQPWLTWGRTREWLSEVRPYIERSHQYTETRLGRRLFLGNSFERTLDLWANHEHLLRAFEQLPVCFCHHYAFRRNLLPRQTEAGASETVAIDWSITGYGRVGEEIGVTTAVNLTFMEVASNHAKELDQAIFAGYVDGLHDAGWQGDVRLARLGYAINASLVFGTASIIYHLENLQKPDSVIQEETVLGHRLDDIIDQWAAVQPFFLDLGEEACKLMQELA